MQQFTITLTDEEVAAMATVTNDINDWVTNALKERARIAIESIVATAVAKGFETSTTLPALRHEVVALAIANNWVQTFGTTTVQIVPPSVTMRQARLALLEINRLNDISVAIANLASPAKEAAAIEWEYSNEVQRYNGFVEQLAPHLNLTSQDLDALFIRAAQL